jgi:alanine racemase
MSHRIFERVRAELSAKALLGNYDAIRAQVPGQSILPMIKAGAYGHGAAWAAKILAEEPALYGLGVATLEEGAEVRKALGNQRKRTRVLVVSGTALWSDEKGEFCEKHGLTATISSEEDWVKFLRGDWHERISYEIKFNTGMNRLGISPSYARTIAKALRNAPAVAHPSGVLSHLAIGENPDEKLSRMQREQFVFVRSELESVLPSTHFHLANSSAIWNAKHWGLEGLTDVVRPGLSLYGVPPFMGAPARGLVPVMTLEAQVVTTHLLKTGERLGYGGTFKAKDRTHVAILAGGYADGLKRSLTHGSHNGSVTIGRERHAMIGTVSMDLCATTCSKGTKPGDWARILGPGMDIWEQARAAGTIPYELLTSVAPRVERVYK